MNTLQKEKFKHIQIQIFLLFALIKNPSLIILQSIIKVLTNIAICVVFLYFVILIDSSRHNIFIFHISMFQIMWFVSQTSLSFVL